MKTGNPKGQNGHWGYTAYITLRNGRRIYASQYGKRAFRIWIKAA